MRAATRRRALAFFKTDLSLIGWLRILWAVVVLWYEAGVYRYRLFRCSWPDQELDLSKATPVTHVLLVSDPQVRYPSSHKHSCLFPKVHDWFYHAGLTRNWRYVRGLAPDAVVFLGDMLDAGRTIQNDDEYRSTVAKFRHIFAVEPDVTVYHVPGNEDVGLNLKGSEADRVRQRYVQYFGAMNQVATISNHTLVFLNAPGLVEEDYQRARHPGIKDYEHYEGVKGGTVDFVRAHAPLQEDDANSVILFSHIPLSRPDSASCGPLRDHGTIRRGAGFGYQNTFGKQTTQFLLETLQPALIFSGDDRDYCAYTHEIASPRPEGGILRIDETTIKSFSPARNVHHPGIHLLSLAPPTTDSPPSQAHAPCFLPSHGHIHNAIYLPLGALTILLLFIHTLRAARPTAHSPKAHLSPLPSYADDTPSSFKSYSVRTQGGRTLHGGIQRRDADEKPSLTSAPSSSGWFSLSFLSGDPRRNKRLSTDRLDVRTGRVPRWRRAARRVGFDFVHVVGPSVVLWAVLLWSSLR